MCGLSPLILLAAAVGITVTSITGSTGAGWAAAAAVAAVVYLVGRRRWGGMCTVSPPKARPFEGLTGAGDSGAAAGGPGAVPREHHQSPGEPHQVPEEHQQGVH